MNYRTLLSILAFIVLCFFANKWYQNKFCCDTAVIADKVESKTTEVLKQNGPIINRWGSEDVVTSNKWLIKKSEIMASKGDKDILEINGAYYADEVNKSKYANLGLARAENAKILMMDKVFIETKKGPLDVELKKTLRFPYKSAEKLNDREINEYLLRVVSRLKDTKEKVYIVGHTDTKGGAAGNKLLGMERANAIREVLINYGLKSSRIVASSMGEAQTIADDSTPGGPEKNRRVEITIK